MPETIELRVFTPGPNVRTLPPTISYEVDLGHDRSIQRGWDDCRALAATLPVGMIVHVTVRGRRHYGEGVFFQATKDGGRTDLPAVGASADERLDAVAREHGATVTRMVLPDLPGILKRMAGEQTLAAASRDTVVGHLNNALACLTLPAQNGDPVDASDIASAVERIRHAQTLLGGR